MRKMESFPLKRVLPYFELLCFLVAWTLGIMLAVTPRKAPLPPDAEREVVATDVTPEQGVFRQYRSFRPSSPEESREGG
jgi:hypothetical protein